MSKITIDLSVLAAHMLECGFTKEKMEKTNFAGWADSIVEGLERYYGLETDLINELSGDAESVLTKFANDATARMDELATIADIMRNSLEHMSEEEAVENILENTSFSRAQVENLIKNEYNNYLRGKYPIGADDTEILIKYFVATASMSRHCSIYKAKDGNWYMDLADEEYGEHEDSTTYGPFSSEEAAEKYLDNNHSNPGGYSSNGSGTKEVPQKSPNGNPVVKPNSRRSTWGAKKRTVHFKNKYVEPKQNDKACFTTVSDPEVTDNPEEVTCSQCIHLMTLNKKAWKIDDFNGGLIKFTKGSTAANLSPMAQKFIDDAQAAINSFSLFDTDGKIENAKEEIVEKKFDKGPLPVSKITFDIINKDNDNENCGTIVILIMEDDKGKKPYLLIKSNDCVVFDSHGNSTKIDKILGWAGAKTPVESAANWLYLGGKEEEDGDDD